MILFLKIKHTELGKLRYVSRNLYLSQYILIIIIEFEVQIMAEFPNLASMYSVPHGTIVTQKFHVRVGALSLP